MRKLLNFTLVLSFIFSLALGDGLAPKKVAKTGEIEVPEGMHLVVDRAGERWVLPLEMEKPPVRVRDVDYFVQENRIRVKGKIKEHEILSAPLSAVDTFVEDSVFWDNIPYAFRNLLNQEKDLNLHGQSAHFNFLGDYGPNSKKAFHVPYIPIPEDDMEFSYISKLATEDTQNLVKVVENGKTIYRMFIHPNYPKNYEKLIKKFGIVYHYVGVTTSSPRSLVVIDPDLKNKVFWIKPSLPKKVDGSVRLNIDTKLRRAVIMSEALGNIPYEAREKYGVDFMIEPASLQPKGLNFGTIFREVNNSLLFPARNRSWMPAFALKAPGNDGTVILEKMIAKSGKESKDFIKDDIIRPFLRAYLNLALNEGLPGEFHTQNFYYELNEKGLPTGKFMFKDNDGFRFDVELAMRKNRSLDYLTKFDKPFYWAKFSNALGTGGEKIPFLGSWYYKLIRNVGGFETLSSYILEVVKDSEDPDWTKSGIQKMFDDIAIEEAEKITGVKLEDEFRYGFDKDKGLNRILHLYRKSLAEEQEVEIWKQDENLQANLREAFEKLKEEGSVHSRSSSIGDKSYFIPHITEDGTLLIEARSISPRGKYKNPTQAIAISNGKETTLASEIISKIQNKLSTCLSQNR